MKHLALLLLVTCALATPRMRVYIPYGGSEYYKPKAKQVDRAKRIFRKLTGVKLRVNKVRYCIPFEARFPYQSICSSWDGTPAQCIRAVYNRLNNNGYSQDNNVLHYYVALPIFHNGTYWIGGAAQTQCYKDVKLSRLYGIAGIGYGNFLETQVDSQTRIPQSIAVMIHEWGHLIFGLTHDEPEENFIMNSLFNVKGFSSQSAPEMWRLSEKSKREIRRCRNGN